MSAISADNIIPRYSSNVNVSAAYINGGTLTDCAYSGGSLSAGTLTGYVINTSTVASPQITTGTISGSVFATGSVSGSSITAPVISNGTVADCSITSPVVSGGTFADFSAEMNVTSGTFTCTGFASDTVGTPSTMTGTYRLALLDPFVLFTMEGVNTYGNGNIGSFATSIPANLRPAVTHYAATAVQTGGTGTFGLLTVNTDGSITVGMDADNSVFTATEEVHVWYPTTMWPIA